MLFFLYPGFSLCLSGGGRLFFLSFVGFLAAAFGMALVVYRQPRSKGEVVFGKFLILMTGAVTASACAYFLILGRPVAIVFEYRLFRVVHADEVVLVGGVPPSLGHYALPYYGMRDFVSGEEKLRLTVEAMAGLSLASRKEMWVALSSQRSDVLAAAKPLRALRQHSSDKVRQVASDHPAALFVPLLGRRSSAIAIVSPKGGGVIEVIDADPFEVAIGDGHKSGRR